MNPQETPPSRPRTGTPADLPARLSAWFSARPRAVLATGAAVVVVALGAGALVAGVSASRGPVASVAAVAEEVQSRTVPEAVAAPARARSCVIDADDPAFAELSASVVNVTTGEQLYARGESEPASSLALQKVLTAAVALRVLGPDTRIATRVYEGSIEGSIVIVGGGDPTLSTAPAGVESVYPGAPKVGDLAAQTKASLDRLHPGERGRGDDDDDDERRGGDESAETDGSWFWDLMAPKPSEPDWQISEVIVDAGLWGSGDMWDQGWPAGELAGGTQANIVPLMVDGDRKDAALATSPRGSDPVGTAARSFIAALDLPSAPKVSHGGALTDRPLLAEVHSQPVSVLVQQMLHLNDHTLADMLARVSSTSLGSDGSASSLQQMYQSVLTEYGIPTAGLVVKDGSGLNSESAVNPEYVARLLALAAAGEPTLQHVHAGLPVAGVSGPLLHRFSGELAVVHSAFGGTGSTGDTATTLGGLLTAADGTILSLSLQSTGPVTNATGLALETLVGAIHACGDNLSDA